MKKLLNVALLCAFLLISSLSLLTSPAHATHLLPADPGASQATKNLLNYLAHLPDQSSHRLISGQWGDWHGMNANFVTRDQNIFNLTGKHVGLWGQTPWATQRPPPFNFTATVISNTINWWNAGGLIQIHGLFPNPFFADTTWTNTSIVGSFADVYTENGNATNSAIRPTLTSLPVPFSNLKMLVSSSCLTSSTR